MESRGGEGGGGQEKKETYCDRDVKLESRGPHRRRAASPDGAACQPVRD